MLKFILQWAYYFPVLFGNIKRDRIVSARKPNSENLTAQSKSPECEKFLICVEGSLNLN